jgi:hypothetical protein
MEMLLAGFRDALFLARSGDGLTIAEGIILQPTDSGRKVSAPRAAGGHKGRKRAKDVPLRCVETNPIFELRARPSGVISPYVHFRVQLFATGVLRDNVE